VSGRPGTRGGRLSCRKSASVLIDPLAGNTAAHRFYARLGFRFVERRRVGDDDCHVYRLERSPGG
jgi:hypothetical protein